ncbi:hypothetical protein [Parvularcula marina]|uniref:Uncharacterized protein n=1 Tax=Parvularcula marina TaxID=2292771 RepID=A0A371RKZ9_9PROT|nr:hypothetical protein [Parvularcula marina]RFB06142.1 hypothetical protein DX908_13215 [Parvularcula marina]
MGRFNTEIPDVLIAQAMHHLSHEQLAVIRGLARAQIETGRRFSQPSIRAFCDEHGIPGDPVLRALGWGPGDHDMVLGRITSVVEDMACTSGAALCALAKCSDC